MRPMYKSVFNIHDIKGLKYLFQLRMNLSPLRSHKKHHNFELNVVKASSHYSFKKGLDEHWQDIHYTTAE